MTAPNNFGNRFASLTNAFTFNSWPFALPNCYTWASNLGLPTFQNQFGYSYMPTSLNNYNCFQIPQSTIPVNSNLFQNGKPIIFSNSEINAKKNSNKKEKTVKSNPKDVIIQISDQGQAQQQKGCDERSTSHISKPKDDVQLNNKIKQEIQPINNLEYNPTKYRESSFNQAKKPSYTKTKNIDKIPKPKIQSGKEIEKSKSKRKLEKSILLNIRKNSIYSQRIIQKNETTKQPYKLSRKERQLLEIGFLRDFEKSILTGPQFQAKLPTFKLMDSDIPTWKTKLKQSLIERLIEDSE